MIKVLIRFIWLLWKARVISIRQIPSGYGVDAIIAKQHGPCNIIEKYHIAILTIRADHWF